MSDDLEYNRELLAIKKRRLQDLTKKAAFFGIDCPSHITLEMTDIQKEIDKIEATIRLTEQIPLKDKFIGDIIEKDEKDLAQLILSDVYPPDFVEDFITDQANHLSLRVAAFTAYIEAGLRNDLFFRHLLTDINQDFRRSAIQIIREYNIDIRQEDITNIISDRFTSQDVLSYTVKLAHDLIRKGSITPAILANKKIYNNSYWLIRLEAISAIIDADTPECVNLLVNFTTTTYWKSRKKIYQYFDRLYHQNRLVGDDIDIAKYILEVFIQDGNSSEKAITQMKKILDKLSNLKPAA